MSFNLSRLISSAIHFVIGPFFFILGIFGLLLPWSSFLQNLALQLILERPFILSLFGLGFVLIGLSIAAYTVLHSRHRTVRIRTGDLSIALDEKLIHESLEIYFQEHFPRIQIHFTLYLKKHSAEVVANLPPFSLAEQKIFLEQIKQGFNHLFGQVLGYPYDVHFIANFQSEQS